MIRQEAGPSPSLEIQPNCVFLAETVIVELQSLSLFYVT
jgi:hypothetical protein